MEIHNLKHVLSRDAEGYIAKLNPKDKDDEQLFIDNMVAEGISTGAIVDFITFFIST